MSRVHLIIPDAHADPRFNNDRADYIGELIADIKPDVLINLGDQFDMSSMASYDKGKKSHMDRSYRADLDAGLEFDERMWAPIRKSKKKRPESYFFIGNHEHRLAKLLDTEPQLEGSVSFKSFELDRNYDEVVNYVGGTPGVKEIDGVHYAHYFVSGVMGRPIGGEHPAYSLLTKEFVSTTCGHIHVLDYSVRTTVSGRKIHGLVAGCAVDYMTPWAGEVNKLWWRGVILKRNVSEGEYDVQFISLEALKKEYGS